MQISPETWAIVAATGLGPIVAVAITLWRTEVTSKYNRRVHVFRTLMATRRVGISPDHVNALNLVEVDYYGCDKVEAAWSEYKDHLNNSGKPEDDAWRETKEKLLAKLLFEIAAVLGFNIPAIDIFKGGYAPLGWAHREYRQLAAMEYLYDLSQAPQEPIRLWAEQGRSLWIGNLARIPEAAGWPELAAFLTAINAAESPIESVGCEKGFFPAAGKGVPPVTLGSYFNVLFTDAVLNDVPESALLLSSRLLQAVEGCESWWSDIEIALERYRFVAGTAVPWGLMLRVSGYGRDESEARKLWGVTLDHLAKAVGELPHDFGWHQDRVSGAAA
jgi:hypothetical protein